jgi:hypothetical protein
MTLEALHPLPPDVTEPDKVKLNLGTAVLDAYATSTGPPVTTNAPTTSAPTGN